MLTRVFASLGRTISRHPKTTVLVWAALTALGLAIALTGVGGASLFDRLDSGAPSVPSSESDHAQRLLSELRASGESLTLVLDGAPPGAEGMHDAVFPEHIALSRIRGVASVLSPFVIPGTLSNPAAGPFLAQDGNGFLIIVTLEEGLSDAASDEAFAEVKSSLEAIPAALEKVAPDATGRVGGMSLIYDEIVNQVEQDLVTGEAIALPLALVVMVLVFGGFLAAAMPLAGALASIAGGLGTLVGLSVVMPLDASVVNVVTVLGLGLSIDYGLLIVSRFREELDALVATDDGAGVRRRRGDGAVVEALRATMSTAGRTVAFSAVTIAISCGGLLLFSPPILRGFGAAGVAVILVALLTALTLVPALLVLFGRRLVRPTLLSRVPGVRRVAARTSRTQSGEGWIASLTARVQRHPWLVLGGTLALLALLASPIAHLDLRNTTLQLLPSDSAQREYVRQVAEQYPDATSASIQVVAETTLADALAWVPTVQGIAEVTEIEGPVPLENVVIIGVHTSSSDDGGPVERDVVHAIRALDPGFPVHVAGTAAVQIDFVHALAEGAPLAGGLVVGVVLVLLFLMTGSLVVPVKALLCNVVSLAASLGVLTWAFQDGHLASLLDFTPVGGIETYVVVLVVAFAFGLAMDYEVFLLARIKELHDAGYPNNDAVREGLQRSGRIITSAAAIIIVVFAGFMFGRLLVIKEVGFALAVAVLIDATIVRLLLVPATMTLLGRWNWWAPGPLRRFHERFGLAS
ncbi:MAG: MMPL family transporter [Actinomycetota bacterium]|nr:MMPL family transporter [Actinomycetota bacterium]